MGKSNKICVKNNENQSFRTLKRKVLGAIYFFFTKSWGTADKLCSLGHDQIGTTSVERLRCDELNT